MKEEKKSLETIIEEAKGEIIYRRYAGSWENAQYTADHDWENIHKLIPGTPWFAYKSISEKNDLYQIIIYLNEREFIVDITTSKYSVILDGVGIEYLRDLEEKMENVWNIDKEILETFKVRLGEIS